MQEDNQWRIQISELVNETIRNMGDVWDGISVNNEVSQDEEITQDI